MAREKKKILTPAFPYTGGKSRLLASILPHLPPHDTYVEAFAGGAALLLAKEPSRHEVINDVSNDLVTFFRYVKFHAPALLSELDGWQCARTNFVDLKAFTPLTELQRAARWFWLQVTSFGAKGEHFGRDAQTFHGYDAGIHGPRIQALAQRLRRVCVECKDYEEILSFYDAPETLFFLDPPYLDCSKTAYTAWTAADMWRLCGAVRRLKGKFLLTVNDSAETREIFAGFAYRPMSIRYSLARQKTGKLSGELLIGNCLDSAAQTLRKTA